MKECSIPEDCICLLFTERRAFFHYKDLIPLYTGTVRIQYEKNKPHAVYEGMKKNKIS